LLLCCFQAPRRFDGFEALGNGCKGSGSGIEDSALKRVAA
jgi:hypothetical protein